MDRRIPPILIASLLTIAPGCRLLPRSSELPRRSAAAAIPAVPPLPAAPLAAGPAADPVETTATATPAIAPAGPGSNPSLLDAALERATESNRRAIDGLTTVPADDPPHARPEAVETIAQPAPTLQPATSSPVPDDPVPDAGPSPAPTTPETPGTPPTAPSPAPSTAIETRPIVESPKAEPVPTTGSAVVPPATDARSPESAPAKATEVQAPSEVAIAVDADAAGGGNRLSVGELRLCRRVEGAGRYEAIEPPTIRPGEPILLYGSLAGLEAGGPGKGRWRVSTTIDLIDPGRPGVAWSATLRDDREPADSAGSPGFFNCRLRPPSGLAAGDRTLRVVVRDEVAGRSAEATLSVRVAR